MKKFDVVVIGTGTAGQTAALDLVAEGYSVAVIEQSDSPGGVCALRGCQAKKWFYEAAETVARCKHLYNLGITTLPHTDWHQVLQEKNSFTSKIPENTINNLQGNGVSYIKGEAVFHDKKSVTVDDTVIQGRYMILATGAKPISLPIEGINNAITSDAFLDLDALPGSIAFIGGGFISFEFAHFAAHLGSNPGDINILEARERPLSPFDGDMVEQLVKASEDEGIRIHTDVNISSIVKKDMRFAVNMQSGETLEVDLVVNSAGRIPNINSLHLEAAEIEYTKGGVAVDANMKTTNPAVYAVGDCAESLQLARVADFEAKTAVRSIVSAEDGEEALPIDYSAVPAVLFTYPQLGMVGKTEDQLKEEETAYWRSFDTNLSWPTYRRIGMKHAAYKILVDENEHIIGAHFLGDNVTGVLNTFKQAMRDKMTVQQLHENNILSPYPSRESDILYMLDQFLY